ncbi:MAG: HAD-IA family hydrolase [Chloroflexi bacterium]|nr:HAD-IA family hydrolase [Chloroflexota bacterium]
MSQQPSAVSLDSVGIIPDDLEAILFDLDGTLVETDNRWAGIFAERLAPAHLLFPRLDVDAWGRWLVTAIEIPGNYAISIVERLGLGPVFQGLTDRVRRSKGLATRGAALAIEGSDELLRALDGRYRLGVVTTRARPEALAFIRRMRWERYFAVVVTRQDVFRMKPHPAPVRKATALLGVSPRRCVLVGDTTMDMRAARRAGAVAVGVLTGLAERRELERAGAQLILARADQLLEHLPAPREDGA